MMDHEANVTSVTAAAEQKDCSRTTIYTAIEDGRLNATEVGSTTMVLRDEKWEDFEPVLTSSRINKLNSD